MNQIVDLREEVKLNFKKWCNLFMLRDIKVVISPPFSHYIGLPWATRIRGTFTVEPRRGIIKNSVKTVRPTKNGWVNKMGLVNKGFPFDNIKKDSIYSITSFNENDWYFFLEHIPENTQLELNVSCPNVNNIVILDDVFYEFSKKFTNVILKLPTNSVKNTLSWYEYGVDFGIKAFHIGNTIKTDRGGLSGREIQKVSIPSIKEIRRYDDESVIIGGGGIYSKEDVKKYKDVGADIISLSTVFITKPWNLLEIKREAFKELEND